MGYLYNSKWFFCIVLFLFMECQAQECLNQVDDINKYFGEKADYVDHSQSSVQIPGCLVHRYWGIIRYDKNEFSTQNYDQLSEELVKNAKSECGQKLTPWNRSEKKILENVNKTILFIAKSMTKIHNIFRNNTNLNTNYLFKDAVSGNREIITEFMKELLSRKGEHYTDQNFTIIPDNFTDTIRNCSAFQRKIMDYDKSHFAKKPEFQEMINNVQTILGYETNFDLEKLILIYNLCRSEKSLLSIDSPWCSVFNEDQLKLLQYNEDLLSYYTKGYGNEYSKNIGCHIVKEMITDLDNFVNKRNKLMGIISFTDSIQFQTLLTALGIKIDKNPINTDNYKEKISGGNYSWRTSDISPIGANFAVVLYDCRPKTKVKFFLNEETIGTIFDCPDGICEWEFLHEKLNGLTEKCTYDFCDIAPESSGDSKTSPILFIFSILGAIIIFGIIFFFYRNKRRSTFH